MNNYEKNLEKNNANFIPLTPLSFLERAKDIYPNYEALVYEKRSYTWTEVYKRCIKFASALEKAGIGKGDTVSVIKMANAEKGFTYISNAGGAFLEWLEGKKSPGVIALEKN